MLFSSKVNTQKATPFIENIDSLKAGMKNHKMYPEVKQCENETHNTIFYISHSINIKK